MNGYHEMLERFRNERPMYDRLARRVGQRLERECYRSGLMCRVSYRAKEVGSLLKKAIEKNQQYDEIFDKAGVRIVPIYVDQRSLVVELVRKLFHVTWEQDYSTMLSADRFAYRGHHFSVSEGRAGHKIRKGRTGPRMGGLVCEVQVQTLAENLWATVNHDLSYKTEQVVPDRVRRSLNRLSALLELVDEGVAEARTRISKEMQATERAVLEILERQYFKFEPRPYNKNLSIRVIASVLDLVGEPGEFAQRLDEFVRQNDRRLLFVFRKYRDDSRSLLLTQPEVLLFLFLLEGGRAVLEENWPDVLPFVWLERLSSVWLSD